MEEKTECNSETTPVPAENGEELNEKQLGTVSGGTTTLPTKWKNDEEPKETVTFLFGKP